ncbi:MAG: hypothetical protein JST30_00715 [Armatimonadetes bacterium]|nr:hypothetical protein [Armatimonadota bacterium]
MVFVLALWGCGGGGGGGSQAGRVFGDSCPGVSPGSVAYSTTWDATHPNASQVVQVLDASGALLRSASLNKLSGSEINISNVPAGIYEIRAALYDGPNATGSKIGETSTVADLCAAVGGSTVNVRTTAASPVARVVVQPTTVTVQQQSTRRFLAETLASNGVPAFHSVGGIAYSVTGGIGTVAPNGLFTATNAGQGSVRAVLNGSLAGAANVTVTAFNPSRSKWTVLVYMNAANDLFPASDFNVNQMEAVADRPADLRFVVQWKQSKDFDPGSTFDGVRRYLVKHDTNTNMVGSELVQDGLVDGQGQALDMGSPGTLLDFVKWGKKNYPADRYVLVIWNHGNGWKRRPGDGQTRGVSYDDQYGTRIDTWQLDQALSGERFDVIAWDASLMQMLEVAYEARGHADFIVGSEESPPAEGYPYDSVFAGFRATPDAATSALTKGFVDGMLGYPPYASRKITQSVLDVTKLPALASALDDLGHRLFDDRAVLGTVLPKVRDDAQSYSPTATRYYRDLYDVCRLLISDAGVPTAVKAAASNVQAAVDDATVWEGHNAQSANSHGVSIDFSEGSNFQSYRSDYIRLKLAADTFWDEFLGSSP